VNQRACENSNGIFDLPPCSGVQIRRREILPSTGPGDGRGTAQGTGRAAREIWTVKNRAHKFADWEISQEPKPNRSMC